MDNCQQQMFRSRQTAPRISGTFLGIFQNCHQRRGQTILLYLCRNPASHQIDNAVSQPFRVQLLCRQCTGSRIAAFLHQPQKQVLTSNIRVPELLRGVYRFFHGKDRLAGKTFCISHIAVPFCRVFTLYFF